MMNLFESDEDDDEVPVFDHQKSDADSGSDANAKTQEVSSSKESAINKLPILVASKVVPVAAAPRSNAKEAKIIELSKKLRNLNIAYEREKTTNIDLSNKLKVLQLPQRKESRESLTSAASSETQKILIKGLKEKLAHSNRKLEEERISNQGLKSELRNTQKALAMEVGEDVNLSKILDGVPSGWKGRAQQIQILKSRVQELNSKLSSNDGPDIRREVDESHLQNIKKISERRQESFDNLLSEFNTLKIENTEMKRKYEAAIARIKCLEKDLKGFKSKIQILVEKTTNDDKLIDAMNAELEQCRKHKQ